MNILRENKISIIILLSLLLSGVLVIYFYNYFISTRSVSVSAEHITNIVIKDGTTGEEITSLTTSKSIRVPKNSALVAEYIPESGYAAGTKEYTKNDTEIAIKPYLSKERLEQFQPKEGSVVRDVIKDKYKNTLREYAISKGAFFHNGEWYGTTLVYKGRDDLNSDTLRIILKKQSDNWSVMNTPDIFLGAPSYPNIPADILRQVNDF